MASTSSDQLQEADAHSQGIDGGLNLKTDPSRLAAPATTRSDNGWYVQPGNVSQLPAMQSAMPAAATHVYNISARDTPAPSFQGDVMVHGEYPNVPGSPNNFYTTPCWAHTNGASVNRTQPVLPHTLKTRPLAGKLGKSYQRRTGNDTDFSDAANMMLARQETATSSSGRRFAMGHYENNSQVIQLRLVFGIIEGMQETGESLSLNLTADFVEIIGIQGTANFAIVASNGATLIRYVYDFFGNIVSAAVTIASNVQPVGGLVSNTQVRSWTTVNHCGQTYVAYISTATGFPVLMYNINTAVSTGYLFGSPASAPGGAFDVFSPTTHQTTTGQSYLGVVYNGRFFVLTLTQSSSFQTGGTLLPIASNIGSYALPAYGSTSFVNALTTGAAAVADASGGVGLTSRITFTVFRHYSEGVVVPGGPTGGSAYQQVAVDCFSFIAAPTGAGVAVSNYNNVFRTPCGAAIVAKAFTACPSEANFAGTTAAVGAFCVVRQGAWLPNAGYSATADTTSVGRVDCNYDQPTYYMIDHQGRVVSRWAEGLAPVGSYYGLAFVPSAGTAFSSTPSFRLPYCLSAPLITDGLATANDVSCLDVFVPTWANTGLVRPAGYAFSSTIASTTMAVQSASVTEPSSVYYSPTVAHFAISSSNAGVPAVQSQNYAVLSGAMTSVFDGRGVTEANWHGAVPPLVVKVLTSSDTAIAAIGTTGFYYYVAVYEWTDSLGRVHRSSPSLPAFAYTAGQPFYGCDVSIALPVTTKNAFGGPITVKLYRSVLNATIVNGYFLVAQQTIQPMGTGAYAVTIREQRYVDLSAKANGIDTTLYVQGQAALYTGGTSATFVNYYYAAQPPPAFIWQASSKGRHLGLAVVLGQPRIYYSTVLQGQFPYEWHALNYAPVPGDVGDARSIECLDDKVLVFGTRTVGFMAGDGPPPTNSVGIPSPNDGYGLIYPIPTALGCIGSGSPSRMPAGVMFQGLSGIQTIGRDLSVQPTGAQVDVITGRQVGNPGQIFGRSQMLASLQSVVWSSATGPSLVYNYLTQKWSTWPLLPNGAAMCQRTDGAMAVAVQPIVGGKFAGRASASVDGADFGFLGTTYSPLFFGRNTDPGLVVETPWILPGSESAGESNVFEVALTGSYMGPHVLQVEQAYNYNNTYQSVVSRYAVPSQPLAYQYRVRPIGGTRMWAVRYRITVYPMSTLRAQYQMAALSDLVLFSGNAQGTTRLLAAQSG